jgi:chromosome segregation ATPase
MNGIKKTRQDMKEEHCEDIGILKKNQSETRSSISQTKNSIESLVDTVEQAENRVSGIEDKVEELNKTEKEQEKILRKHEWNMQDIWDTMKRPNLLIMGMEEGEEIQTKGTDNLFNKIIPENFPNLEKEKSIQVQLAYRLPNHYYQKKKHP